MSICRSVGAEGEKRGEERREEQEEREAGERGGDRRRREKERGERRREEEAEEQEERGASQCTDSAPCRLEASGGTKDPSFYFCEPSGGAFGEQLYVPLLGLVTVLS